MKRSGIQGVYTLSDELWYVRCIAHRKYACRKEANSRDASEMDEDTGKLLSAMMERNAYLHFAATGQRADEEWW